MRAKATEINESPAKVPALDTGNIAGSAAFRNGNKLKHIKHTFDPRVTPSPSTSTSFTVTVVGTKGASEPPPTLDATLQLHPIPSVELMRAKATEINESPAKDPALDTGNIAGTAAFRYGNKLKHTKHAIKHYYTFYFKYFSYL
jgi:hypothetical protein